MSLNISDMVLIPQGVYLISGQKPSYSLVVTSEPQYGIIVGDRTSPRDFNAEHIPIVIGDTKYYVKEEDIYPCT